jgi:hypothetical protein
MKQAGATRYPPPVAVSGLRRAGEHMVRRSGLPCRYASASDGKAGRLARTVGRRRSCRDAMHCVSTQAPACDVGGCIPATCRRAHRQSRPA